MKIRTLIVDDEPLARERIRSLLEQQPEIELIGECDNGLSALETIQEKKPELVFLDVQMPEMGGFEVLDNLKEGPMPAVIFCTAHDQFALQAFEVHALDYLLKPFDRERFEKALGRAVESIKRKQTDDLSHRLSALLSEVKPEPRIDRILSGSLGRGFVVCCEPGARGLFFHKIHDTNDLRARIRGFCLMSTTIRCGNRASIGHLPSEK
jgi:two-component system LytT family response regulator